jgi:DNA-binding transcriptional regulator YiaG
MSQTNMAEKLGISVWTLRNWEQNRRQPRGAALLYLETKLSRLEKQAPTSKPTFTGSDSRRSLTA